MTDKFGDNGVVSVVIGHQNKEIINIELWIMSCRVLKRNMECAMMDVFVDKCRERGIQKIIGHYYPTAKNGMVKDFYSKQGFSKVNEDNQGNSRWILDVDEYKLMNDVIKIDCK